LSSLALAPDPPAPFWEEVLAAAIRPVFAVERYVAHPGDVLFGKAECAVSDCMYPAKQLECLCLGHASQFRKHGVETVDEWLVRSPADGGPAVFRTRQPVVKCAVAGCPRSVYEAGICAGHHQRWRRHSGRGVRLEAFIATTSPTFRFPGSPHACRVLSCGFPRRPQGELCDHHHRQFHARIKHCEHLDRDYELEDFLVWAEHSGRPIYSVAGLPSPLAAEIQFALQCRSDERQGGMPRDAFATVRLRLRERAGRSLMDLDRDDELFEGSHSGPFLRYARDRLEELAQGATGLSEWDFDVWRIARLPGIKRHGCTTSVLSFEFCQWPWLRSLFKRWIQWRLATGISASTAVWNLRGLQLLVEYCEERGSAMVGPGDFTRELLEGFVVHLASLGHRPLSGNRSIGAVRTFLDDCRRHDWMPGLDPKATYYRDDYARRPEQQPRYISEHVMAQLEANLDRLPTLTSRTLVEILIGTGLRAKDALELELDALTTDAAGGPYLRYFNHKLSRERFVPISESLAATVRRHRAQVRERFPAGSRYLLPRATANPDGERPYTYATLTHHLKAWERRCDFREEDGSPAHLTAHRFRHTLATRMINHGVPEVAVQQMLDHSSPTMTRVYARLHDRTLREHYDRYQQRINIGGEVVALDPDGPLSDAAWAKERLARAKLTLPNGYCGRPLQSHCPHPNACLTCPDFLTTVEHLPAHRDQLASTIKLIDTARAGGHERLVEQNEQIRLNLVRIIEGLEALPRDGDSDGR
jgi:integrase